MKKVIIIILSLALSLLPLFSGLSDEAPALSLLAINVRKADALLLHCGNSAYLIDAGSKDSSETLLSVLREEGVTRLDGVILTHTHADHVGGLKALVQSEISVGSVYAPKFYTLKKEDGKHPVEKALKKTNHTVTWLEAGDTLPLSGGTLTVLGPLEKSETENCNSLVLLAEGGGGRILLTGDMEFPEEDSLLKAGQIPQADVIKIGNHGEGDATSAQLLTTVQPKLAVISTNTDDEPDTPDPRVLKLLNDQNIPYLLTQDAETGVLITLANGELSTGIV